MLLRKPVLIGLLFCALTIALASVHAQIVVEGVDDQQVYANRVSFRVLAQPGFACDCSLDAKPVPTDTWIEVTEVDYHELTVQSTETASGNTSSRLIRFIVRSTERGNSEWGLRPWVTFPVINSGSNEFAGATLCIVAPRDFPLGQQIPVIAFLEDAQGRPVRANGMVSAPGFEAQPIQIRRGVGSGFLPPVASPGPLVYQGRLYSLQTDKQINIEPATDWTPKAGEITGSEVWSEDSRIYLGSDLSVPAGATLTIGAGSVIQIGALVNINVGGRFIINGTTERPVVLAPKTNTEPWGGFIVRSNTAQLQITGAILTGGGGDPDYFENNFGVSHRDEQAVVLIHYGAGAYLTNCYLISNVGQAGNGYDSDLVLDHCLIQRCISSGEYEGGSVYINQSALIEFPEDDGIFADDDNDAIYFTEGTHVILNSLVGWAKDDGIDSGSGGAGSVIVSNCWIEACFHEGLAWSGGGRVTDTRDTVVINCGQGIEAGWSSGSASPLCYAERLLSIGNLIGARFGDNYDWNYNGFLRVTNSFLLYNHHNIFGRTWADNAWTNELDQMDLRGNYLSIPDSNHPDNMLLEPQTDGWRLARFLTTPASADVGVAFATRSAFLDARGLTNAIPIGLSSFSTNRVKVDYSIETPDQTLADGSLEFDPGQTIKTIPALAALPGSFEIVRVALRNPVHAEFTGCRFLYYLNTAAATNVSRTLIATGSVWHYMDDGSDQGTAWRALEFDDSSWKSGPAESGFGDNDEATPINGGPSDKRHATTYFRRSFVVADPGQFKSLLVRIRRDDGAIAYINNAEVYRGNVPAQDVAFDTYTGSTTSSETAFFSNTVSPSVLRQGTNAIAVEVHQANETSSDLSFELELIGFLAMPPRIDFHRFGEEAVLSWADSDFILEKADRLGGPWTELIGVTSPASILPADESVFYRLRSRSGD